jgi:hypothetical protein
MVYDLALLNVFFQFTLDKKWLWGKKTAKG